MHVIGHHYPCAEPVPFRIEAQQRVLDQRGQFGPPKVALAVATIEISFELRTTLAFVLDRSERLPFVAARGGHGIGEPESDHLKETRLVANNPARATPGTVSAVPP